MIYGNWVALHKGLVKYLPDDRPYTIQEAMFSLSVDIDNKKKVSVAGYAVRWQWSRTKVRKFLRDFDLSIAYSESTSGKQNQKGQIEVQIRDRSEEKKEQIRYIAGKELYGEEDRSEEKKEQMKNRSKNTTIDPNNNPNPKKEYSEDSNEFRLALFLLNNIRKRKPDFKIPNLQMWAQQADYILRLDKRDLEEAKKIIVWCQRDEFWQDNVLSTAKLRKQYDQLVLKMRKTGGDRHRNLTAMPGAINV